VKRHSKDRIFYVEAMIKDFEKIYEKRIFIILAKNEADALALLEDYDEEASNIGILVNLGQWKGRLGIKKRLENDGIVEIKLSEED